MYRSLVLAVAACAMALPAAAASVKINVAGLDSKAAHEKIVHAAEAVCSAELSSESALSRFYQQSDCVDATVAATEAKLVNASNGSRPLARL